jgi:hypothetical protein
MHVLVAYTLLALSGDLDANFVLKLRFFIPPHASLSSTLVPTHGTYLQDRSDRRRPTCMNLLNAVYRSSYKIQPSRLRLPLSTHYLLG